MGFLECFELVQQALAGHSSLDPDSIVYVQPAHDA
jgi:hypothetical protein